MIIFVVDKKYNKMKMKKILLTLLLFIIVNLTYCQLNIIATYDSISCYGGTTDINIQISNGTAPYIYINGQMDL
jgi:hypothetical protein